MAIVGWMEHGRNEFKNAHLINRSRELSLVAICGEPGSGKTTLARLLYHDPDVSHHFPMRAWFSVGNDCNVRDLLVNFLCSLNSSLEYKERVQQRHPFGLLEEVRETLNQRRYLIVLDDVCSRIWASPGGLKHAFPNTRNGSRVIVTTTSEDFEPGMDNVHRHNMSILTGEEPWELFCKLTVDADSQHGLGTQSVTIKEILRSNCCRLPLATVVVAGMVKSSPDWEDILGLTRCNDNEGLQKILAIGYVMLPEHLKPCFLYLGQFSADKEISVEKMCLLWMAEGIISTNRANGTKLDEAKSYYNELIASGLVIEVENNGVSASSQRFASCKIPRSIHKMCRELSGRNFRKVPDAENINLTGDSPSKLAIYLDEFEDTDSVKDIKGTNCVKSVLFFDLINRPQPVFKEAIDLEKFKSTEVLDFNGVNFGEQCQGLEKLKRLRYLSFQGCILVELPASIIKCRSLETLDLGVIDSYEMIIPDVLQKLSKLKHLYFPKRFRSAKRGKLKLDKLNCLVILENFHCEVCNSKDLDMLTELQSLTCIGVGNAEDLQNILNAMKRIVNDRLHHTSLVVDKIQESSGNTRIVEEIFSCSMIHFLDINCNDQSPTLESVGSNFTKMVIKKSGFEFDPMRRLGELSNLTSLVLSQDAFRREKLLFCGGEFPKLRSLQLEGLYWLNELDLEPSEGTRDVLPCLATLTIKDCDNLINLPEGLAEMETLEKLITNHEVFQSQIDNINSARRNRYRFLCLCLIEHC